ncbi:SprT family zinc-dependent metalloprotease [Palleronia sp. LCG004]|uniref:M48 family metallopeptidase n=1 Tax=Palleronia sp. LCG004 TaxID=3079304 RepID=UPI002941C3D8|nr:SprT family zinc-dependent metalloprotease [Palleronia sp. LCG004]WOI55363.1 SprT family zinc-dependent metalloprotease [Palleronia sp. LCG004]
MVQDRARRKTLPGEPPVELVIRRSGRARRISLRVSALDGRVTLSVPAAASERAALDFAASKASWIRAQLACGVPAAQVGPGTVLSVLGRPREVAIGSGGAALLDREIRVSARRAIGPQVAALLKEAARDALERASRRHAAAIGCRPGRITMRDTRSRWGSCSAEGNLNYSWRLVLAPPDVLDYVAAHEVAHLRHMDHSRAFWSVVEELRPDWRDHRDWLRREGSRLHGWRFE